MENSSGEVFFFLESLNETRGNKQIIFAFTFLIYFLTIFVNLILIKIIFLEKILHDPMYIFLCSLCFSGIYGATGFYPQILVYLLSDSNAITYSLCITQIFVIYTFIFCQFTNLTVMAYDRYVAICKPLEYHSIITPWKVGKCLLITWFASLFEGVFGIMLTASVPPCGFNINKIYCSNWGVVKLSCKDTTPNNIYGYVLTISIVLQVVLIIISYVHIIRACVRSRAEQSKFMQTCLPHLISLINFTVSIVFDVMYARYGSSSSLPALRHFMGLEYLVVPPLLNPLIYGLKLNQIRTRVFRMCRSRKNQCAVIDHSVAQLQK